MGTYSYTGNNPATNDVEIVTVTSNGIYDIEAFGGQGGAASGGSGGDGVEIGGLVQLYAGETLKIIVGGQGGEGELIGPYGAYNRGGGGGGGGSFVLIGNGQGSYQPLAIAGGGGGGGTGRLGYAYSGSTSTAAGNGGPFRNGGSGGVNGGGGGNGYVGGGGGGGGFAGSGGPGGQGGGYGGNSTGGTAGTHSYGGGYGGFYGYDSGGFGGGGGGSFSRFYGGGIYGSGGGGGGYGGGGGGNVIGSGGGGGGGSFFAGTPLVDTATHTGAGEVIITQESICYLRGTRILTPTGEAAVEDLHIGDLVVTRFGGIRPISWIGRQSFAAAFLRHDPDRLPVCIRAGALAERTPARDLYVSPGHSMLIGGTLILAEALVNGVTITQDWCPAEVHYYQLDLGTHDCVIAEAAWSETFADGPGLRDMFHNRAEFETLFPEYSPPNALTLCAPRPERGADLDAALRPLVARAAAHARPGPLQGYIDRITDNRIPGWAFDAAHPDLPMLLDVFLGETHLGSVLACDYRADLQAAGFGRGRCSFLFTAPITLTPDILHTVSVRRAADGAELTFTDAGRAAFSTVIKAAA
jgi:hypothetical protein